MNTSQVYPFSSIRKLVPIRRKVLALCLSMVFLQLSSGQSSDVSKVDWKTFQPLESLLSSAAGSSKFLFVEISASWCAPCHRMDKEVFSNSRVASLINERFMPVKLEVDDNSTHGGNLKMKQDAVNFLLTKYHIKAYPTFLFFSPNGQLLSCIAGFKEQSKFYQLLNLVLDTPVLDLPNVADNASNQSCLTLTKMAMRAQDLGQNSQADSLAQLTIVRFGSFFRKKDSGQVQFLSKFRHIPDVNALGLSLIKSMADSELLVKKVLEFCLVFNDKPNGPLFRFLERCGPEVDSAMQVPNLSESIVDAIVDRNVISPLWDRALANKKMNWDDLEREISSRYGSLRAKRIVLKSQKVFFKYLAQDDASAWPMYFDAFLQALDEKSVPTSTYWQAVELNNFAWDVFKHSDDLKTLNKALQITDALRSTNHADEILDTYANLLYKIGRKHEAIDIMLALAERSKGKVFQITLERMRSGLPTW